MRRRYLAKANFAHLISYQGQKIQVAQGERWKSGFTRLLWLKMAEKGGQ